MWNNWLRFRKSLIFSLYLCSKTSLYDGELKITARGEKEQKERWRKGRTQQKKIAFRENQNTKTNIKTKQNKNWSVRDWKIVNLILYLLTSCTNVRASMIESIFAHNTTIYPLSFLSFFVYVSGLFSQIWFFGLLNSSRVIWFRVVAIYHWVIRNLWYTLRYCRIPDIPILNSGMVNEICLRVRHRYRVLQKPLGRQHVRENLSTLQSMSILFQLARMKRLGSI
jgi:hypothetical protein